MLRQIELNHFKCFEHLKLPLSPLTLLAGTNASGKSTVLQALGLLHQTMKDAFWSRRLLLNGSALRLGTLADVVDQVHGRRTCGMELVEAVHGGTTGAAAGANGESRRGGDERVYAWEFTGEPADRSLGVSSIRIDAEHYDLEDGFSMGGLLPLEADTGSLPFRLEELTYLSAERLGPRDFYRLRDSEEDTLIGAGGENTASLLEEGRDRKVLQALALPDSPPTRLPQVQRRMADFFPGCVLDVHQIPVANVATLAIRTSDDTAFHRPVHTGFGLTQVLPIVVAALAAKPASLLLIENPEVHLHPGGQSKMGMFLAEVAAAGVQVLVESHSDHLLNGIRRAVQCRVLEPQDAAIHYFSPRQGVAPQVQTPTLDADGGLDAWPEGFLRPDGSGPECLDGLDLRRGPVSE